MIPALLIAVVALTACGEDEPDWETQAQAMCLEAVADKMKDPNSTEFRNVTVEYAGDAATINFENEDGTTDEDVQGEYWKVLGEVNAKNGFGAMVGFRDFECEANKYEGRDMDTGYVNVAKR
ncbi:hypothetical protein SAMN04490240_4064 [Rhodococcus pyridinivorans]|nr:hypothetical protein SAMN04490240_4064 [Rhodococcus pyridinivorans]